MKNVTFDLNIRWHFYKEVVRTFIKDNKASILVIAGSQCDRNVFFELGFGNVMISNIDPRMNGDKLHPYKFSIQDAQDLTYSDNFFNYVVIHGGLHHCRSPHRALLEMYRVARIGVLVIESRDNFLIKLSKKLKITETYEIGAVCADSCKFGGLDNREIPNYIYRWTENEIEKTISSFAPYAKHNITYKYGFDFPTSLSSLKNPFAKMMVILSVLLFRLLSPLISKQGNLFAVYVRKPTLPKDLFPWISMRDGELFFNKEWVEKIIKIEKFKLDLLFEKGDIT